jgi:membrane protein DedA with SNARE-associated domain
MPFAPFSVATFAGAGLWCAVLAWFGREVIGGRPDLMTNPDALVLVMREKLHWFVAAVVVLGGLYAFVLRMKKPKGRGSSLARAAL